MYRPVPSDPPWRIKRRAGPPPPAGRRWAAVALSFFRAAVVAALGGAAFAAALADARALVWATIVLALPVVALADELARRTAPR